MSNPLFNQFGRQQPTPSNPLNNMFSMLQNFNNFKQNFRGDPKQQVQQLLQSGRMSQEQFNQLSQIATQFRKFLG